MKPNIILINCDDMGYGDLACYGSKVNDTPAVDRLCENGLKLTDFYMASPVCSPSRGAMLTGCYPPRIGFGSFDGEKVLFPGQGIGLSTEEKTIAKMLKEQNYATMLVGKWHCGDQPEFLPTKHGFDHYYGLPYSNDMGVQAKLPGDEHRHNHPPLPLICDDEVIQEQPEQASLTERYTEQAVRFIRQNRNNNFFLYFAHMHVHVPHYSPKKFTEESRNGEYGASVAEIDWSVDVIVKEIEKLGLSENTLIIFTSDNGSNTLYNGSNGVLRGKKATTWEGGQRVPCVLYWKGKIAKAVSEDIISSIDFYATFAKLTDANLPEHKIDSIDFSELLFGNGNYTPKRDVFFYYNANNLEAVRKGDFKLHLQKDGKPFNALYNLREDIGESVDIYNKNPEIVAEILSLADECRQDLGDRKSGIEGKNIRPAARVENPKPLTQYDPNHPYIVAMYDKTDRA